LKQYQISTKFTKLPRNRLSKNSKMFRSEILFLVHESDKLEALSYEHLAVGYIKVTTALLPTHFHPTSSLLVSSEFETQISEFDRSKTTKVLQIAVKLKIPSRGLSL
jgi:hypothetical protein